MFKNNEMSNNVIRKTKEYEFFLQSGMNDLNAINKYRTVKSVTQIKSPALQASRTIKKIENSDFKTAIYEGVYDCDELDHSTTTRKQIYNSN